MSRRTELLALLDRFDGLVREGRALMAANPDPSPELRRKRENGWAVLTESALQLARAAVDALPDDARGVSAS